MAKMVKPDVKINVALLASAVTTILIWIVSVVPPHAEIPGEIAAAITTVVGFIFGYFSTGKKPGD